MSSFRLARRPAFLAVLMSLVLLRGTTFSSPAAAREAIHIRTHIALAAGLEETLGAFSRQTGIEVAVDVGDVEAPEGTDLVVGDESEMTRLLEGQRSERQTALDLGSMPWVETWSGAGTGSADEVVVLGGPGRDRLGPLVRGAHPGRVRVSRDARVLSGAGHTIVPRSMASGSRRKTLDVPPVIAVAVLLRDASHPGEARRLLAFLAEERDLGHLGSWLDPLAADASGGAAGTYATRVVDWWVPQCSLEHNSYNDPAEVLGPPNAESLGGVKDKYSGMMSLGQAGYVVVELASPARDGEGPDLRVYQTTASEPVTLYASTSPTGPFVLVGLRVGCGSRTKDVYSNHCDFDLGPAGIHEARYVKVEDGEIYPCLAGTTATEGADIDAIEVLNR